jgi:hypothetical protein
MKTISKDYPDLQPVDLSQFKIERVETEGKMLTRMMGIFEGVKEIDIRLKPKFDGKARVGVESSYKPPAYFPYKNAYETVYINSNTNKPKLLVIQDSFGSTLEPFLSEHFSKSVFIFDGWQHNLNEKILLNEKPDIFIQLVSESLLPNIPENAKKP